MSNLIVIAPEMHKIAELAVNVQYRYPGNVVSQIPVEFEIFVVNNYFKAVPLHTHESKQLTDLPDELFFQVKDGVLHIYNAGTTKIIETIVQKLVNCGAFESPQKPLRVRLAKGEVPKGRRYA